MYVYYNMRIFISIVYVYHTVFLRKPITGGDSISSVSLRFSSVTSVLTSRLAVQNIHIAAPTLLVTMKELTSRKVDNDRK